MKSPTGRQKISVILFALGLLAGGIALAQPSVASSRARYTALGHRTQTFADTRFVEQVRGGLFSAVSRDDEVFSSGFE